MKRKTKRKALTEMPWDDKSKFERAFQEYLGQLSATFDGDGNLRDDAPSSGELPDPTIVHALRGCMRSIQTKVIMKSLIVFVRTTNSGKSFSPL
jgi:hypothetical protein